MTSAPDPQQPSPSPGPPRDRRRDLAGIGFALIGAYFAVTSYQLESGALLRAVLVLLGVGVFAYGVVQLVRRR